MSHGEVRPANQKLFLRRRGVTCRRGDGCAPKSSTAARGSPVGVCQRPHAVPLRLRALRDVGFSASQDHETEQPVLHPGPAASLSLAPGPTDTAASQATLSVEESSAFKLMV